MALPTSYMTGNFTKIPQYFDTLLTAQAPEKFTVKFFADLGFTSSNDRQFINVLKSIGFLDNTGVPTQRYFSFLDQSCSKQMVAEGIKEAYSDLFALNVNANTLSKTEVEGKFKTLTNGAKATNTISQMASTFINLCAYADWSVPSTSVSGSTPQTNEKAQETVQERICPSEPASGFDLNYDIHIHLPATRDQAVYDALFASLAKHLPLK